MSRRGNVLGSLLLALVASLLAFVVAAVAMQQLTFSSSRSSREQARNCAESVASLAMAKILANPDFGKWGRPGYDSLLTWTDGEGGQGTLSFKTRTDMPWSTSNLQSDVPARGWKRVVPSNVAQLVGYGRCRGTTWATEILLHTPEFPYCIASSGDFQSDGAVLVGQLNEEKPTDLSPDALLPGSMASQSASSQAVILRPGSLVTGDVEAVGGVVVNAGAIVRGHLRPTWQPTKIPIVDMAAYCPSPSRSQILPPELVSTELKGNCIRNGDLSASSGLSLNKSVLYVKGDLTVSGGLRGVGAVIVDGKTTIEGGVTLETDNKVAILSRGDVSVTGSGPSSSSFRGLVYSTGNVHFENITVIGSFVANKPGAAGGSKVELKNSRAIGRPEPFDLYPDQETLVLDLRANQILARSSQSSSQSGEVMKVYNPSSNAMEEVPGGRMSSWSPPPGVSTLTMKLTAGPDATGTPSMFVDLEHSRFGSIARRRQVPLTPPPRQDWPNEITDDILNWINAQYGVDGPFPTNDIHVLSMLAFVNQMNAEPIYQSMAQRVRNYPPTTISPVHLDLSQFLSPQDKIRVLLSRELPSPDLRLP